MTITIEKTETITVTAENETEAMQKTEYVWNLRDRYNRHHWNEEE